MGMEPVLQDAFPVGTSLYCFSVYTENTGTTKKNEELETLQYQFSKGLSIFACEEQDVFADVEVEVGPGLQTIKVEDADNDWHFAKRKETGAWINTGMFTQVWKAIASGGKASSADWVAKVDADAVFVPSRLATKLQSQLVPPGGIYLENCKYVEYGYFGNLEVFSMTAKPIRRLIGRWVSRMASMALWARICSRRHAWINSVSAESRLLPSPQMELARPTGQSINRKTKSGRPRVHGQPRQPCTHSRK